MRKTCTIMTRRRTNTVRVSKRSVPIGESARCTIGGVASSCRCGGRFVYCVRRWLMIIYNLSHTITNQSQQMLYVQVTHGCGMIIDYIFAHWWCELMMLYADNRTVFLSFSHITNSTFKHNDLSQYSSELGETTTNRLVLQWGIEWYCIYMCGDMGKWWCHHMVCSCRLCCDDVVVYHTWIQWSSTIEINAILHGMMNETHFIMIVMTGDGTVCVLIYENVWYDDHT